MMEFDSKRDAARWGWCGVTAGVAHAAVLAGLLVDVQFGSPSPPQAAMVVELAPDPVSLVLPPTEIPPGPPQVEARRQPKLEPLHEKLKFEAPPRVVLQEPPELLIQEQPEERPEEQRVADRNVDNTTALPTNTAPPADKVTAPREGANSAPSTSPEQTWESRLLATIERNKRYPGAAQRQRQEDVIYVRFAVDRHGKVLNCAIERSRGFSLLDQEVLALLERSSPLPAPPDEVSGERIEVVVPVEFYIRRGRG